MALESDIAQADTGLHVEFYPRDEKLPGGGVRTEDYCRIVIPGDKTQMWDQPAREHDKQRFPRHWLAYQMSRDGGQVFGTPLSQWNMDQPDLFNENQMVEMLALKFQTVEQIAGMADMQMQRVGMGAASLKVRATAYLTDKNRSSSDREHDETKRQLAELQAQMTQLLAGVKPAISDTGVSEFLDTMADPADATGAEARYAAVQAPKPDGRRKPMAEAQKAILRERLAKAREAKKGKTGGQQHASDTGAASHG